MGRFRFVIAFYLLLVPVYAWAWGIMPMGSGVIGASEMSCTDADLICESFEGSLGPNSEYDLSSWTETDAGSGSLDAGAAHYGSLSCTDKGSDALKIVYGTTPGDDTYSRSDIGSDQSGVVWISFYFYINSESINFNSANPIFHTYNTSSFVSSYLRVIDTGSSTFKLRYCWYNGTWYCLSDTASDISLQTWHKIDVLYNNTGNAAAVWIDGSQKVTGGDSTIDRNIRYVNFGSDQGLYEWDVQVENIKIDDDTRPGACP